MYSWPWDTNYFVFGLHPLKPKETIKNNSFDGDKIEKRRFAKIRSVDCYREASLGIQFRPCSWPHGEVLVSCSPLEGHGPRLRKTGL